MKHLLTPTVAFILMAGVATSETVEERTARCAAQGEIVSKAVELRLKRKSEARAKAEINATTEEALQGAIPLLVGYIYTLSRKDLKSSDVPTAFVDQCSALEIE